jgi:hypothetical protein
LIFVKVNIANQTANMSQINVRPKYIFQVFKARIKKDDEEREAQRTSKKEKIGYTTNHPHTV